MHKILAFFTKPPQERKRRVTTEHGGPHAVDAQRTHAVAALAPSGRVEAAGKKALAVPPMEVRAYGSWLL